MNLKGLRVFVNVMEEGTLARASAKMNLSQPAASRLLQLVEGAFDVALFRRDRKRLVPTPEGEAFYPEALRILSSIDEIPALFALIKEETAPALRVLCHPRIAYGLVVPAMGRLCSEDPSVRLKLEIYPRRDIGRRIMTGLFDLGISTLPLPVEEPKPSQLGSVDLCVALPRGHPLARRSSLRVSDLRNETYIALDQTTVIRQLVDRALADEGSRLSPVHEVSTSSASYRLVRHGVGFAFADRLAMDPALADAVTLVPFRPAVRVDIGFFLSPSVRARGTAEQLVVKLREICSLKLEKIGKGG